MQANLDRLVASVETSMTLWEVAITHNLPSKKERWFNAKSYLDNLRIIVSTMREPKIEIEITLKHFMDRYEKNEKLFQ